MLELLETYEAWRAEGVAAGRAVVIRTFGSAPRGEGAVLLVAADGRMIGSVSGGCVEGAAAQEVQQAIETGRSRVIRYGITDEQAWDVGLACGGTIDVLVEPAVPAEAVAAALESTAATEPGSIAGPGRAVITPLPADLPPPVVGPHPGTAPFTPAAPVEARDGLVSDAAAAIDAGRSRVVEDRGRWFFVEAFPARPRLVVVGATEVTRWLVGFARDLGYVTVVIDGRPAFATPERFPDVDRLLVAWPDEAFDTIGLGPSDAVAVLSHDPKFDEPAIVEAFRRGARYVGAVGSRKTQADRHERLVAAGLPPEDLQRLRGPIGLDLGGREPSETALAIMAEIVAARRGGTGEPLRSRRAGPASGGEATSTPAR
jgi:xanthine dehydrogenase accessory factor